MKTRPDDLRVEAERLIFTLGGYLDTANKLGWTSEYLKRSVRAGGPGAAAIVEQLRIMAEQIPEPLVRRDGAISRPRQSCEECRGACNNYDAAEDGRESYDVAVAEARRRRLAGEPGIAFFEDYKRRE